MTDWFKPSADGKTWSPPWPEEWRIPEPKPRQSFAELIDEWYGVGLERAQQIADEIEVEVSKDLDED